jgi:tRNA A37 threonylcarbamoyladenosine dehydratase
VAKLDPIPIDTEIAGGFGGIARLYGREGLKRLLASHVCVVGIGGVGSWAAEAIARSAVGSITLIDLDEICQTNLNRQVHALENTIGRAKVDVMRERIQMIRPDCRVDARRTFFTAATADAILATRYDYVVDAIDNAPNKCRLIVNCRDRQIPIICAGAAGGRCDPNRIVTTDLSRSVQDSLLARVRKMLRKDYGFPRDPRRKFRIDCVFSSERAVYPHIDGTVCTTKDPRTDLRLDCESGFGTVSFVTGAFGFALAARVVETIAQGPKRRDRTRESGRGQCPLWFNQNHDRKV